MPLANTNPTGTQAWSNLREHYQQTKDQHLKDLFQDDPGRAERFSLRWGDFLLDYSKNRISDKTMALLQELARECHLQEAIASYFGGDAINQTEGRAVLHTALRADTGTSLELEGSDIMAEVAGVKEQIRSFSNAIIDGSKKGFTGKAFTDVVNIGIGGSDLGPVMVTEALQYYSNHLRVHFVSNVDGDHVHEVLKGLDPETTFFIIVSKSFTTQETLSNALTIKKWFLGSASEKDIAAHLQRFLPINPRSMLLGLPLSMCSPCGTG